MACLSISIWLWLTMAGTAAGQAVVEAGLGAAGSATAAASSRSVGNAISGLAGSLDKAIKAGQQDSDAPPAASSTVAPGKAVPAAKTPSSSSPLSPSSHTAHAAAPPAPKWEDPSGIQAGLSYAELVRRFGPPALEISGETGRSLTYAGKDGTFRLDVVGDQVTSIRKPKS
jgi:hypothetical protein